MSAPVYTSPAFEQHDLLPSSELDKVIFAAPESSPFLLPLAEQNALRRSFVRDAIARHLENSPAYSGYAERRGWNAQALVEVADLGEVPLVPTSVFKRLSLLSVPEDQIAKKCMSSGTRGPQSVVARDRVSLERLLGSVMTGLVLIDDWYEHELEIVNLGPDRTEAGDIWFPYVMSLVELLYPTTAAIQGGRFKKDESIELLARLLDEVPHVGIAGPPFLLLELIERMEERQVRLAAGERMTILTAGGWKRHSGVAVARPELEQRAAAAFGLEKPRQFRDAFNQVELNTVFVECEAQRKHIPPWVHATTLDPATLKPTARGEPGLMAYLDASATSYPAFVLSDDVGVVEEGSCGCGKEAVTVKLHRRVEGRIQRGCALSMDKRFGRT